MSATYGEAAFAAYAEHQDGKTHDGRDIPAWVDLTDPIRGAWEAAAGAVIRQSQEGLDG